MTDQEKMEAFLDGDCFAVVGASTNRAKYGNKVLRCYLQNDRNVVAINPHESEIEGAAAYHSLSDVPDKIHGISIITPPVITEQIVSDAIEIGIKHIWMQPGAESRSAIEHANDAGINVIAGGPCILVVLGYTEK